MWGTSYSFVASAFAVRTVIAEHSALNFWRLRINGPTLSLRTADLDPQVASIGACQTIPPCRVYRGKSGIDVPSSFQVSSLVRLKHSLSFNFACNRKSVKFCCSWKRPLSSSGGTLTESPQDLTGARCLCECPAPRSESRRGETRAQRPKRREPVIGLVSNLSKRRRISLGCPRRYP